MDSKDWRRSWRGAGVESVRVEADTEGHGGPSWRKKPLLPVGEDRRKRVPSSKEKPEGLARSSMFFTLLNISAK
jgi:hypothetical protein